jgi:hypothetical protein
MEVIQIYLALRLELVKEVKEAKGENGAGASPGCWKPTDTKELTTEGVGFRTAQTVHNLDGVNTRDVE